MGNWCRATYGVYLGLIGGVVIGAGVGQAQQTPPSPDTMDADKQRACEAVLCLSTDDPPKECAPSLETFFSIQFKKPWKTFKARKNFLEMCPSEDFHGKAAHIDVLAEGAGVCEMDNLLASLNVSEPPYSRELPEKCRRLVDHEFTTGFTLPVRTERCSDDHLIELGPRPQPQEEWAMDGYDMVTLNQEELDTYDRAKRFQAFQPTAICVSRWSDPAAAPPEQEVTALLGGEVERLQGLSEQQYHDQLNYY